LNKEKNYNQTKKKNAWKNEKAIWGSWNKKKVKPRTDGKNEK